MCRCTVAELLRSVSCVRAAPHSCGTRPWPHGPTQATARARIATRRGSHTGHGGGDTQHTERRGGTHTHRRSIRCARAGCNHVEHSDHTLGTRLTRGPRRPGWHVMGSQGHRTDEGEVRGRKPRKDSERAAKMRQPGCLVFFAHDLRATGGPYTCTCSLHPHVIVRALGRSGSKTCIVWLCSRLSCRRSIVYKLQVIGKQNYNTAVITAT